MGLTGFGQSRSVQHDWDEKRDLTALGAPQPSIQALSLWDTLPEDHDWAVAAQVHRKRRIWAQMQYGSSRHPNVVLSIPGGDFLFQDNILWPC